MTDWHSLFDAAAEFDPAGDLEAFLRAAPAKWVVYLVTDADDQPVQLLCVKNLRASLKRRLGQDAEQQGPSRRVDYRGLVRRVYWRRVDSAFEADVVYLEAARAVFPQSYRGMLGFEPAWFVHADLEHRYPRLVKTIDLTRGGTLIGPVEDKHVAARLIQLIEDAFDLCRYYNVLTEAPRGRPCAYKEMGKCPAPCDGTISMAQYYELMRWGIETAVAPDQLIEKTQRRMADAAAGLNFEAAGKVKQYLDQLSQFGAGPFKHVRRIEDFRYVTLQPGGRPGTAKVFVVTPGRVLEVSGLIGEVGRVFSDVLRLILELGQRAADLSAVGAERIGVAAGHLLRAKKAGGVFIAIDRLEDRSLAKAWKELQKQKAQEGEGDEEGVVKELQRV
ncbi:MAG: hypothetical protein ACAI43_11390 [Phycisphaerae bacterium]|nr:hypothetical protein [Tepidisphaeraceae bacterium]